MISLVICALYLADTRFLVYNSKALKETVVQLVKLTALGMYNVEVVVRSSRGANSQDALATSGS